MTPGMWIVCLDFDMESFQFTKAILDAEDKQNHKNFVKVSIQIE